MTYNFKENLKRILENDAMSIITEQMGFPGNNNPISRKIGKMRPQLSRSPGTARSMDPPNFSEPPPGYEGIWGEGYTWTPCGADCGPYSNGWVQVYDQNGELTRVLDPGPDGQFGGGDDQVWPPGSEQAHNGNVTTPGEPQGCFTSGNNCITPPGEFDRQKRWFKPVIGWCLADPPFGAGAEGQLVIAPDSNGNWTWWMEVNNPDYDPNDPNSQAKIWAPYDWITRLKEEGWDGTPEGLPDWAVIMLSIMGGFLAGLGGAAVYDLVFKGVAPVNVPGSLSPTPDPAPILEPPVNQPPGDIIDDVPLGPPVNPGVPPINEPPVTEPPNNEPPVPPDNGTTPPVGGGDDGTIPGITYNDDEERKRRKRPYLG